MMVLLDTSQDLDQCSKELGLDVEQLLTPLTRYRLQRPRSKFAIDNGAFSQFNERAFLSLLAREYHRRDQCIFVCAPDVVGSFDKTLQLFHEWKERLKDWPRAFVLQDGLQISLVPWDEIAAVFVGGSNKFKGSFLTWECLKVARSLGKWIHIGRVNNPNRYSYFYGLADSCDGTGLSRYTHMRQAISRRHNQRGLFGEISH